MSYQLTWQNAIRKILRTHVTTLREAPHTRLELHDWSYMIGAIWMSTVELRPMKNYLWYCRHFIGSRMHLHMFVYNQPPPVFHKVNRFPSPNSTWTVQNSLNNLDTHLLIVHHLRRIQRPGIILALLLIMLTFLNIVWQQRGLKMQPRCAQQPEYTLPHLPEVYRKPLKYGYLHTDTQWWSQ